MQNLAIKEPVIEELEESSSVQAFHSLHTKVGKPFMVLALRMGIVRL